MYSRHFESARNQRAPHYSQAGAPHPGHAHTGEYAASRGYSPYGGNINPYTGEPRGAIANLFTAGPDYYPGARGHEPGCAFAGPVGPGYYQGGMRHEEGCPFADENGTGDYYYDDDDDYYDDDDEDDEYYDDDGYPAGRGFSLGGPGYPGGQGRYPGDQGHYPGSRGFSSGGPGYPGGPAGYPGGQGHYPAGPGYAPAGPCHYPGGPGRESYGAQPPRREMPLHYLPAGSGRKKHGGSKGSKGIKVDKGRGVFIRRK